MAHYRGYLRPEHLALLEWVLTRIVGCAATPVDDLQKQVIAERLIAAFELGVHDEDELVLAGQAEDAP